MITPTEYRVSAKSHEQVQVEILTEIIHIADRVLNLLDEAGDAHKKYMMKGVANNGRF